MYFFCDYSLNTREDNTMIKKTIASILILIIFINSIGCMVSYKQIGINKYDEIEEAREIRLTTVDNKEYILRNVRIEGSIISGNQWVQNEISERRIKFSVDQISKIEAEEFHLSTGFWIGFGIIVLLIPKIWDKDWGKFTSDR